jgi:hypothetical protein
MQPKLGKQAQELHDTLEVLWRKRLLTETQYHFLEQGILEKESRAIVRRFIINTAGLIAALGTIFAAGWSLLERLK